MVKKRFEKILITLVILLLVTQFLTLYFVFLKTDEFSSNLNETKNNLEEQINLNSKDSQTKFNELSNSISLISTEQSDFKEELSRVKASTSADFSGIIEDNLEGVVTIKTDVSQGTGFLITNDGYVVTNYHVMEGAKSASIITSNNQHHSVFLVGTDSNMDVALLKISGTFNELSLGDSSEVKVGEKVLAIGNPLGLSFTSTEGIISAKERIGINGLPYYFQTDVSLNPGNSGGPLLNTEGEVIGINNFKVSGAENIGFSLEIEYAVNTINKIAQEELNLTLV